MSRGGFYSSIKNNTFPRLMFIAHAVVYLWSLH